jgi:hypothetical protein
MFWVLLWYIKRKRECGRNWQRNSLEKCKYYIGNIPSCSFFFFSVFQFGFQYVSMRSNTIIYYVKKFSVLLEFPADWWFLLLTNLNTTHQIIFLLARKWAQYLFSDLKRLRNEISDIGFFSHQTTPSGPLIHGLKGHWHEIFDLCFFSSKTTSPRPPIHPFSNIASNLRRYSTSFVEYLREWYDFTFFFFVFFYAEIWLGCTTQLSGFIDCAKMTPLWL